MMLHPDGYTIIDNRYITELSADEHTNEITLVIKKAGLMKSIVFNEDGQKMVANMKGQITRAFKKESKNDETKK